MPSAFAMSLSVAFSFSLTFVPPKPRVPPSVGGLSDFTAHCAQPRLEGRRLGRSLGVQKSRDLA